MDAAPVHFMVSRLCELTMKVATDWDRKIIDAVSIGMNGTIGTDDDIDRLRNQIEGGQSEDKLHTACEIAVAFIRFAQDLKRERNEYRDRKLKATEMSWD